MTTHCPSRRPSTAIFRPHQHQPYPYYDVSSPSSTSTLPYDFPPTHSVATPPSSGIEDFRSQYLALGEPVEESQTIFPTGHSMSDPSINPAIQQSLIDDNTVVVRGGWDYGHSSGQMTRGFQQRAILSGRSKRHHRETSGSSVASAGPASPYSHTTSHPQLAVTDASLSPAGADAFYDGSSDTYQKALPTPSHTPSQDGFYVPGFQNYNPQDSGPNMAANIALFQVLAGQHANDDGSVAPAFSNSSRPSVSSVGQHSPATPKTSNGEDLDDGMEYHPAIPKLARTVSDTYRDELYNPPAFASSPLQPPTPTIGKDRSLLSPYRQSVFSERLQAANNSHLNTSMQSPTSASRDRSPFRQGSPLAPSTSSFGSHPSPHGGFGSATRMREHQNVQQDVLMQQHQQQQLHQSPEQETPNTISPKDAMIEYRESEESAFPLFPPEQDAFIDSKANIVGSTNGDMDEVNTERSYGSMATSRRTSSQNYAASPAQGSGFSFAPPSVPGSIQVPQHYPFISTHQRRTSNLSAVNLDQTPEIPMPMNPADCSSEIRKPSSTMAETGTYTCTYHGCTLRFETPAMLQKHKREGHRQATNQASASGSGSGSGSGSSSSSSGNGGAHGASMTSAALLRNSQAGPHKCERINPSTGKPCNTIFSRPYDLTRHEDTIHNVRKQKVRCQLCAEEKTFSRNDALTRHMRVVHPEVDFPGKSRRKHHS
jgi:protein RPN4